MKDLCLAFHRFSIEILRYLSKNALTTSVFELEICFCFFLNRSEFARLGLVLVRNLRAQSEIRNHEGDQRVSVRHTTGLKDYLRFKGNENSFFAFRSFFFV